MHVILRRATPADAPALRAFYNRYAGSPVLAPDDLELNAILTRGLGLVMVTEETTLHRSHIIASTAIETVGNLSYAEVRRTLVDEDYRGFGFHRFFFRLRVAVTVLTFGPEYLAVAGIYPPNLASLKSALHAGYVLWDPTPEERTVLYGACWSCTKPRGERVCCNDFYIVPRDTARTICGELAEIDTAMLPHRETKELCLVHLDPRWWSPAARQCLRTYAKTATPGQSPSVHAPAGAHASAPSSSADGS